MCSLYAVGVLNIPLSVLAGYKNTHETPSVTAYRQRNKFRNFGYDAGCHYSCNFLNAERLSFSDCSHFFLYYI